MRQGLDRARRLRDAEITYHAVDSYTRRVPGAGVDARGELEEIVRRAIYLRTRPTGEEIWAVESEGLRLHLVVHRIARRPPMVLTVMVGRDERRQP